MSDVEFKDYSIEVKSQLANLAVAALEEAAGELEAQVIRNTAVGEGHLKNSWQHRIQSNNDEHVAQIGSPLQNALWEEFGTGEYALNGNGRKTPWYIPVDSYKGKKKPTFQGQVVIVYGKNNMKYYKTDGKRPKRPFYRAYSEKKNKLIQIIQNKLKGGLSK